MKKTIMRKLLPAILLAAQALISEAGRDFRFSPYVWFAGLKGDMGTVPPASVPVDVSAVDAAKDTRLSFMALLEAKKGKHGVLVDFIYTDVRSEEDLIPSLNLVLQSKTKTALATLAYQHTVVEAEPFAVDLFAGLRGWSIDSVLQFGGGAGLLAGRRIENDETWIDPVLGVKVRVPISKGFYASGGAGTGGFGVGSDFFYDVSLNAGYQWNEAVGTVIGYRIFGVDYENDGYIYDVVQQGWQLGLTWAF